MHGSLRLSSRTNGAKDATDHMPIRKVHICMYVHVYICMYACMHVSVYAFTHARTQVNMYVCVFAFSGGSWEQVVMQTLLYTTTFTTQQLLQAEQLPESIHTRRFRCYSSRVVI